MKLELNTKGMSAQEVREKLEQEGFSLNNPIHSVPKGPKDDRGKSSLRIYTQDAT